MLQYILQNLKKTKVGYKRYKSVCDIKYLIHYIIIWKLQILSKIELNNSK